MPKNICLIVEYLGTKYYGFQLQAKADVHEPTIQGKIEDALEKLYHLPVRITYSSRTDRGVHALGQVLDYSPPVKMPLKNIKRAMNVFLPADIRVIRAKFVPQDFHSRFKSKSKIYRYLILNTLDSSVFKKDFSWHLPYKLDINKMKKAAKYLVGLVDFKVLAKDSAKYHDTRRRILSLAIKKSKGYLVIEVEGVGFLRHMVRNIARFLTEVGQNRIRWQDTPGILAAKVKYHSRTAPARGLYLVKVNY